MVVGGVAHNLAFTTQLVFLGDVVAEAEQKFKAHVTVQCGRQLGAAMVRLVEMQAAASADLKCVQGRRMEVSVRTDDGEAAFQADVLAEVVRVIRERDVHVSKCGRHRLRKSTLDTTLRGR